MRFAVGSEPDVFILRLADVRPASKKTCFEHILNLVHQFCTERGRRGLRDSTWHGKFPGVAVHVQRRRRDSEQSRRSHSRPQSSKPPGR